MIAEPLTISFECPQPNTSDVDLINVLKGVVEHFDHIPFHSRMAALKWFNEYAWAEERQAVKDQEREAARAESWR